jgi:hypothetical protein
MPKPLKPLVRDFSLVPLLARLCRKLFRDAKHEKLAIIRLFVFYFQVWYRRKVCGAAAVIH